MEQPNTNFKLNHDVHEIQPRRIFNFLHSNYFCGQGNISDEVESPISVSDSVSGYAQARTLLPDQNAANWEAVLETGLNKLSSVFKDMENPKICKDNVVTKVVLSDDLQAWRESQHSAGRILPSKGYGLSRTSEEVIDIMGVRALPPPLLTNGALFGVGFTNFLLGAHDSRVMYSNYCTDMGFYYEHGYHKVFPEYEEMLHCAAKDSHAMNTIGGKERRMAADIGLRYTRTKIGLEEKNKSNLTNKTARLTRSEALLLNFCECSIWGMAAESIARGSDIGGLINDFAFSSPGTDVIDVGSDIHNSELFNSFLNTSDIADSGIVTEETLRRVYDAYAHSAARMFTTRWSDPGARMCSNLFTWHIQNQRHHFLRRVVLGYCKVRSDRSSQREADFDEVFDESLHTTGFSRPLVGACNGEVICDHVTEWLLYFHNDPLLEDLWFYLSRGPLEYALAGVVDEAKENELAEGSRIAMARAYSYGLVDELAWVLAHSSQHAWQVNYLFEAAMFGSILDDGALKGKLDRLE
ncbi:hypothetical protein N7456_012130 [Penicillium angulare]|uniref:Uncharacterized protein n=1 Tax=Penicillium angulare TaxID=116970 RepID=A0A9W9K0D1_9EURO|nr:hypothetical protein N7456_012130 [Penicillium angulare]